MPESKPQLERTQQRQLDRFTRMGLAVRPMPDGRSLLVSMPLRPAPFEGLTGAQTIDRVVFATVGADHVKCLRPRALFGLPMLDVRRCSDAAAIETALRDAWRTRTRELRDTARTLAERGVEVGATEGASVLAFSLPGEPRDARLMAVRIDETILPSVGRLSGLPLEGLEERVFDASVALDSGAELGCRLGTRIQEIERIARTREEARRQRAVRAPSATRATPPALGIAIPSPAPSDAPIRRPKVLLVGNLLIQNAPLREALKRQGYVAATARSETEALTRLAGTTPDLILSQYVLGRSDGASLAQATRALPGIAHMPIVLFDDTPHAGRREAARAVGAAGYVTALPDPARFVEKLDQIVDRPRDRRFKRYPLRVAARLPELGASCLATEVGRGGIFLATEIDLALHSGLQAEIALPDSGRHVVFAGEVLYRGDQQGTRRQGLGVRFCTMTEADESALIAYLSWLEANA
ncbi:MAG TPA: response regulator [Myxococcota bacterium]|nr:response regulator [Myxococcota bacterium]